MRACTSWISMDISTTELRSCVVKTSLEKRLSISLPPLKIGELQISISLFDWKFQDWLLISFQKLVPSFGAVQKSLKSDLVKSQ